MKKLKNMILIIFGSTFLLFGIIGLFLPILPTTPFLLLSASCYLRSSKTAYRLMMSNKILGKYIFQYRILKSLPRSTKISALAGLWITILASAIFVPLFWVKILLLFIAVCVSIHITTIKSMSADEKQHFNENYQRFVQEELLR